MAAELSLAFEFAVALESKFGSSLVLLRLELAFKVSVVSVLALALATRVKLNGDSLWR